MARSVRPVDEVLPLPKLFALGLQHVLVMYAAAAAAHAAMFHHMSLVEDSFGQLGAASRASA